MESNKMGARFFNSTRGRIVRLVRLVRDGSRTVEELAHALHLTDNAVRSHLSTLERDGLMRQEGVRRGPRKPHFTYALTPEAEYLFPKSYDTLLNVLLKVLKEKVSPKELQEMLRQVGRNLAATEKKSPSGDSDLSARVRQTVALLESMGGAPRLKIEGDQFIIHSESCPVAAAVESNPEICCAVEAMIGQITGARVRETCANQQHPPHCSFEITEKTKKK
jgi:predicted ArsR family transcriptional regulator